jgi:uncharacterized membrane protein
MSTNTPDDPSQRDGQPQNPPQGDAQGTNPYGAGDPFAKPTEPAPGPYSAPTGSTPPPGAYPPPSEPFGQPGYQAPGQGYGAYGAGYGAAPAAGGFGDQPVQVGDAFGYAWAKFTQNLAPILLAVVAYFVGFVVLVAIFFGILVGGSALGSADPTAGLLALGFGSFVFVLLVAALAFLVQAAMISGSLAVTSGRQLTTGDFFRFPNLGNVVLTALAIAAGTAILSFTFVGSIIFGLFSMFALYFVMDKNLGVVDAFKASFTLVMRNAGTCVLLLVLIMVANFVGSLPLGLGLVITVPVSMITTAYVYRRLVGEQPA